MKYLKIDDFDPEKVDVSFLEKVAGQIPDTGSINPAGAENLATLTLKAADLCGDLLGQSTLYLAHCDGLKRSAKSVAIKTLLANKKPSTVVKEIFADDPDFVRANNKYNMALAWHTWLQNKQGTLIKTHHLCKDLIREAKNLQGASGWEPSTNSTKHLESDDSWNV